LHGHRAVEGSHSISGVLPGREQRRPIGPIDFVRPVDVPDDGGDQMVVVDSQCDQGTPAGRCDLDTEQVTRGLHCPVEPPVGGVVDVEQGVRMGEVQLRGHGWYQPAPIQQRGEHTPADGPQFLECPFGFAEQWFQLPGQVLIGRLAGRQFGVDCGRVRDDPALDRVGQPLPRLILDTEQSASGRRQLGRLGHSLLDACVQLRLQQGVAERHAGLRCDVLEQLPLEGSQCSAGRQGHLDTADLLSHVQHREYQRRNTDPHRSGHRTGAGPGRAARL